MAICKDQRQIRIEERRVALLGIFAAQPLGDGQRAFGQHFIDEETLALGIRKRGNDGYGRVEAIPRESGAAPDMDRCHSIPGPFRRPISWMIPSPAQADWPERTSSAIPKRKSDV